MKVRLLVAVAGAALVAFAGTGEAGMDEARK